MAHNCIIWGSWSRVKGSKFNADDNHNDNLDDDRWLKKNKCCEGMQYNWERIVFLSKKDV